MGVVRYSASAGRVKVYAYATAHAVESHNLLVSAVRAGLDAAVVGTRHTWRGWRARMLEYRDLCAVHAPTALVVLSDAYDVVVTAAAGEGSDSADARLEAEFTKFGADVVVAGDTTCCEMVNCVPLHRWWAARGTTLQSAPPYKHVNAGLVMGRAGALCDMYEWMLAHGHDDDQRGLGEYMNAFPARVALDADRALFWCHTFVNDEPPRRAPFFTHYAGPRSETKVLLAKAYAEHGGDVAIHGAALSGHAALQERMLQVGIGAGVVMLGAIAGLSVALYNATTGTTTKEGDGAVGVPKTSVRSRKASL